MYDQALLILGQVSVGDQRLHDVLDANAAMSSSDTRAFVLGAEEAAAQHQEVPSTMAFARTYSRSQTSSPADVACVAAAMPEPFLDWQQDLGASRKEIPAAKAALKLLFEIELAAGALPKNTKLNPNQPQVQYRALAEGALSSSRTSIRTRIDTIAAANHCHPPPQKRPRTNQEEKHDVDADDSDENILKVSEVMYAAAVWEPVWKPYMSDLSNRMLQLKCHDTDGSFSERRRSIPFGLVHKYKKPDDWPMASQAVHETKSLYEKRIRELLEDAFVRAGTYDDTLAFACSEAARRLATQLRTADLETE
jgi:hypothetical protein